MLYSRFTLTFQDVQKKLNYNFSLLKQVFDEHDAARKKRRTNINGFEYSSWNERITAIERILQEQQHYNLEGKKGGME